MHFQINQPNGVEYRNLRTVPINNLSFIQHEQITQEFHSQRLQDREHFSGLLLLIKYELHLPTQCKNITAIDLWANTFGWAFVCSLFMRLYKFRIHLNSCAKRVRDIIFTAFVFGIIDSSVVIIRKNC